MDKRGQTDMPEWVQLPPQVNAKCDEVMKLSVFGTWVDTYTHIRQNLYILATRAVIMQVNCCKLAHQLSTEGCW